MELVLDNQFKISTDSSKMNLQLEQLCDVEDRKTKEIKKEWKIISYHGHSLRSVLHRYRDEVILNTGKLESIDKVLDKFNEIERVINNIVNPKIKSLSEE